MTIILMFTSVSFFEIVQATANVVHLINKTGLNKTPDPSCDIIALRQSRSGLCDIDCSLFNHFTKSW